MSDSSNGLLGQIDATLCRMKEGQKADANLRPLNII